jgi:hypothetical protein
LIFSYELQFAAGNMERQHDPLFGQFAFRAQAALMLELYARCQQGGGRDGSGPPRTGRPFGVYARQHALGEPGRRLFPLQRILQFVIQPAHKFTIPIVRATFSRRIASDR